MKSLLIVVFFTYVGLSRCGCFDDTDDPKALDEPNNCSNCGVEDTTPNKPPANCDNELYCTRIAKKCSENNDMEERLKENFESFKQLYEEVVLLKEKPFGQFPQSFSDQEACDTLVDYPLISHVKTFPYGWAEVVQETDYHQYFRLETCSTNKCNKGCFSGDCSDSTTCQGFSNNVKVLIWQDDNVVSATATLPQTCKCVKIDSERANDDTLQTYSNKFQRKFDIPTVTKENLNVKPVDTYSIKRIPESPENSIVEETDDGSFDEVSETSQNNKQPASNYEEDNANDETDETFDNVYNEPSKPKSAPRTEAPKERQSSDEAKHQNKIQSERRNVQRRNYGKASETKDNVKIYI